VSIVLLNLINQTINPNGWIVPTVFAIPVYSVNTFACGAHVAIGKWMLKCVMVKSTRT